MLRRRSGCVARFLALATFALSATAEAAPPVRLHLAEDSTCEGTRALATRLAGKGIVVSPPEANGGAVDVDVRAMSTPSGADAELVIRAGTRTATRSLNAPTCDEVLDALVFALGLALEQPIEDERAPEKPPAPAPAVEAPPSSAPVPSPPVPSPPVPSPPVPSPLVPALAWGGGAAAGVFIGASPSAAVAVVVHADVESRAVRLVSPSAILGGVFVLPSSTASSGTDVTFALQMGTLDGCPLRIGGSRAAIRPCLEVQVGRLQSRSSGFVGARLESSPWVALALALRGRAEIAAGVYFEVDLAGGSPLIQEVFSVGDQRVFGVGPVLLSATAGVGVHFP
jgi:hypothetical protein